MNKGIFWLWLFAFPALALPESTIEKVTVFQDSAEIVREGNVEVKAGESAVPLLEIPRIQDGSAYLQLFTPADAPITLLDVVLQPTNHPPADLTARVLDLQRQLARKKNQLETLERLKSRFTLFETRESTNNATFAQFESDVRAAEKSIEGYDEAALREREETERITAELAAAEQDQKKPAMRQGTVIQCKVRAEHATTARFRLRYVIPECGWRAAYQLHASDTNLVLTYFGQVRQETGEDWKNVKIALSTVVPNQNLEAPKLAHWYLVGVDESPGVSYLSRAAVPVTPIPTESEEARTANIPMKLSPSENALSRARVAQAQTELSTFATTFVLEGQVTIPSGPEAHRVLIQELPLAYASHFEVAPKVALQAVLVGEVTNNTALHLLSGTASIFYQDGFVGQTQIKMAPGESVRIALGEDDRIQVERTEKPPRVDPSLLGRSVTRIHEESIKIKNLTPVSRTIIVSAQVPVSRHKDIKVELQTPEGAKPNEFGELSWTNSFTAGQTRDYPLKFTVSHPKSLPVQEEYLREP